MMVLVRWLATKNEYVFGLLDDHAVNWNSPMDTAANESPDYPDCHDNDKTETCKSAS